jgi:hexosaminidase
MKRLFIFALAVLGFISATGAAEPVQEPVLNVIPWPAQLTQKPGSFALTDKTMIQADPAFANEAALLATALSLPIGTTGSGIVLKKVDGLAAEGYTLEVTPEGATIAATTPAGAFYGCQTLRQLVTDKKISCISIQDAPRIAWRGFMLDVSRHFFDKDEVKARLDEMALLKLNVFHWHLTDDHGWRIEIKKYPKLTEVGAWHPITGPEKNSKHSKDGRYGGFYTQDEIREIVAYAAARHIRIVPEIDMPGHMSAACASYPELSPANGWTPLVARQERGSGERCAALCVGRPKTVQFCKDVLEEILPLFPSKEIHVGGDEVFTEQWDPCPDMQALKKKIGAKDWVDVQIAFQNEISAFLIEKGRTAIFWNNIYRQTVDKRSINHFWRNMANARDFANNGFDVLMSPYVYYLDHAEFSLEATYRHNPLAIGVKAGAEKRMIGIEACEWTERVPDENTLTHRIYPRLVALAESGWTPHDQKDWPTFQKRVANCPVVPADIRKNLAKSAVPVDPKPFHSALAGKAKPQAVPAGNLACWKRARLLVLDESKAAKPASPAKADIGGIDGNLNTAALADNGGKGWCYDVDLEALVRVKQLKISFEKGEATTALQVGVSADGIVWNTVYDKTPADRSPLTVNLNPGEVRFIRLTQPAPMAKDEKTSHFMGIAEIEAY